MLLIENGPRVFAEGSYAVSDWQAGSKVHFLSPSGNGMWSIIDKKIANEEMVFKHTGIIKDGNEEPAGDWASATETYLLNQKETATELKVVIEITENEAQYFKDIFPKALEILKSIAENRNN